MSYAISSSLWLLQLGQVMVDLLCRWLFVLLMVRHSVHLDLSPCYFLMAWLLFRLCFLFDFCFVIEQFGSI